MSNNIIDDLEKARKGGTDIGAVVAKIFHLTTRGLEYYLKSSNLAEVETLIGNALVLSLEDSNDEVAWYMLQRLSDHFEDRNWK